VTFGNLWDKPTLPYLLEGKKQTRIAATTTILRPFFPDNPGKPLPEKDSPFVDF